MCDRAKTLGLLTGGVLQVPVVGTVGYAATIQLVQQIGGPREKSGSREVVPFQEQPDFIGVFPASKNLFLPLAVGAASHEVIVEGLPPGVVIGH